MKVSKTVGPAEDLSGGEVGGGMLDVGKPDLSMLFKVGRGGSAWTGLAKSRLPP